MATSQAPDSDAETNALLRDIEQRRREQAANAPAEPKPAPIMVRRAVTPEAQARIDQRIEADAKRQRFEAISSEGASLVRAAGARYRTCRFDNFATEAEQPHHAKRKAVALAAAREYAADLPARMLSLAGLVLYGPVGTGKDHLAYCVARQAVIGGMSVRWLNGQDWFGDLRDGIDEGRAERSTIGQLAAPDLLVISDPLPPLPGSRLGQHQATMLYRAIDDRYCAGRLTLVTLNVASDDEADSRLGAPTWDRICHGAWKVFCDWPTYRKPAREVSA